MSMNKPASASSLSRPRPVELTPPGTPLGCNPDWQQVPLRSYFTAAMPAANRVYTTGESAALTSTASTAQIVKFDRPGWVVGLRGCITRKGAYASLEEAIAGVAMSATLGTAEQRPLITDGNTNVSASLAALFGTALEDVYPLQLRVRDKDQWLFSFTSRDNTANARAECIVYVLEDIPLSR